jgi:hypothetical protein
VKRSSASRKPASRLPESLNQQLNMYALSAATAGVTLLALAQPSEARVVYTPADQVILRNSSFDLDLNHDGKVDFEINATSGCTVGDGRFCQTRLYAYVPFYQDRGNAVVGNGQWPFHAYALKAGRSISPAQPVGGTALYFRSRAYQTLGHCTGSWTKAVNRYLGLRFVIAGQIHFGWARLSATCKVGSKMSGILTGYAYESTPDKPILAGQTSDEDAAIAPDSLGGLALGAR